MSPSGRLLALVVGWAMAVVVLPAQEREGPTLSLPVTVPPARILEQDEPNRRMKASLDVRYEALRARQAAALLRADQFNRTYVGHHFPEGSAEALAGAAEQAWLTNEAGAYRHEAAKFAVDVTGLRRDRAASIRAMVALAEQLPDWGPDEVERARSVMTRLRRDGAPATMRDVADTWTMVSARDGDAALAAKAAAGAGPTLAGIGTQAFQDCVIFAVAAAAGRPYGFVSALATRMIREGTARGEADRRDPGGAIKRAGLNGDELILLVESFGQAELVRGVDFARTLREGRPVLVNLAVSGDLFQELHHEVALSRTFQHEGRTWFEVIDSNLGINVRHYMSEAELSILLVENGIAYRPDSHRIPRVRRP